MYKDNLFLLNFGSVRSNISGAALSSHLICDIVVSNAQAGAVIGRQGSHIKRIMSKSRALVAVSCLSVHNTLLTCVVYNCIHYHYDLTAAILYVCSVLCMPL